MSFLLEGEDNGMPSLDQILPYVLRLLASDRQWCLCGIRILLVDRLLRTSLKPISDGTLSCS